MRKVWQILINSKNKIREFIQKLKFIFDKRSDLKRPNK